MGGPRAEALGKTAGLRPAFQSEIPWGIFGFRTKQIPRTCFTFAYLGQPVSTAGTDHSLPRELTRQGKPPPNAVVSTFVPKSGYVQRSNVMYMSQSMRYYLWCSILNRWASISNLLAKWPLFESLFNRAAQYFSCFTQVFLKTSRLLIGAQHGGSVSKISKQSKNPLSRNSFIDQQTKPTERRNEISRAASYRI